MMRTTPFLFLWNWQNTVYIVPKISTYVGALHSHTPKKLLKIKNPCRANSLAYQKKLLKHFCHLTRGPKKTLQKFQKSFCHLTRGTKKTIKSKNPPIQRGEPKKYSKLQKPKKITRGHLIFQRYYLRAFLYESKRLSTAFRDAIWTLVWQFNGLVVNNNSKGLLDTPIVT